MRLASLGILAVTAVLSCARPVGAEEIKIPSSAMSDTDQPGGELVNLFAGLCLGGFPDDAKLDSTAKAKKGTAMTPEEVKARLHDDPGHGWIITTPLASYGVTIEQPPFHTCAVRARYKTAPKFQLAYQLVVKGWASNNKIGPVQDLPPQQQAVNGLNISATMMGVPPQPGQPQRNFMALTTAYPNGEVEIRLVHQLTTK